MRYKPSTLPGSSGSPVYNRAFNVVALHHNRGQIATEATFYGNNQGIPLALIREHLRANQEAGARCVDALFGVSGGASMSFRAALSDLLVTKFDAVSLRMLVKEFLVRQT